MRSNRILSNLIFFYERYKLVDCNRLDTVVNCNKKAKRSIEKLIELVPKRQSRLALKTPENSHQSKMYESILNFKLEALDYKYAVTDFRLTLVF